MVQTVDEPKARIKVTVNLHSFSWNKGALRTLKTSRGHPLQPNMIIDARFRLQRVTKSTKVESLRLSQLDGRYPEVQEFLNRYGNLERLVTFEVGQLVPRLRFWSRRWTNVHVAIGSNWGRHRAVAVQEMLARELRSSFAGDSDLELVIRSYYHAFEVKPMVEFPRGQRSSDCNLDSPS